MDLIHVDLEKCQKDKLCIIECPFNILKENSENFPEVIPEMLDQCMNCGHCLAVCPTGALTLQGVAPKDCEASRKDVVVEVSEMEALLKNRRSVRVYRKKNC